MSRTARWTVFFLFFLSGISGLVYEVVWTRQLAIVFGNTVFAVSTVLAAYMMGLALGSVGIGRYADVVRAPLRGFAQLEIAIALCGLLLTAVLWHVGGTCLGLQRSLAGLPGMLTAAKFIVALVLLLIPTVLMGGTLPFLSRVVVGGCSRAGQHLAMLYALNTLGAAVGCFLAGYRLIGRVGLNRTVAVAAALNLVVGVSAWMLSVRLPLPAVTGHDSADDTAPAPASGSAAGHRNRFMVVLAAVALSGFAALGYEIAWTRALVFLIGNSVYAFAAMLTTFLTGIAIGSAVASLFVDRVKRLLAGMGLVQWGIAVYALLSISLLAALLATATPAASRSSGSMIGIFLGASFRRPFQVMIIPTFLLGMSFPMALRIVTTRLHVLGRRVGAVYAANTVGAVLGSVLTGFVLVPRFGLQTTLVLLGTLNLAAALALCLLENRVRRVVRVVLATVITGTFAIGAACLPPDAFHHALAHGRDFVFYREDVSGTVWVEESGGHRKLVIDGRDVAGTNRVTYDSQRILGHLPLLLHPDPKAVFVLGFGAGDTCRAVSTHAEVAHIDTAEFCRAVIDAAPHLASLSGSVLDSDCVRLFVNDGRNVLLTSHRQYDVISVDLLYPDAAGTGSLYGLEFYALCRQRLAPGGIVSQWLPPHMLSRAEAKTILRTVHEVFGFASLWYSPYARCLLLVASAEPLRVDVGELRRRLQHPAVHADLTAIGMDNPYRLLGTFVAAGQTLIRFAGSDGPINTDDRPFIEYSVPSGLPEGLPIRKALHELRQPVTPILRNLGGTGAEQTEANARLETCHAASAAACEALIALKEDRPARALQYGREALELDPGLPLASWCLGQAYFMLAHDLLRRGDWQAAVNRYLDGLTADPVTAADWVAANTAALERDPDDFLARIHLSLALAAGGRTEEALAHARTARALDPASAAVECLLQRLRQLAPRPPEP